MNNTPNTPQLAKESNARQVIQVLTRHLAKQHLAKQKGKPEIELESPSEVSRFPPHSPIGKQLTAPARMTKSKPGFFKD